ncbi:unnamed protein product (mitochondrion) [Plasmodiophora brassicae]|uniref:RCC1-like domain-containing protein n=1 Tax=Plasmodiophora brassicae TaxID=37360 RepID=A0A0G4ITD5_PLABS|nr:hypothetical protein PBRA_006528 [Plasmodiophora brassicae]SPQ94500.1 unnamed protein product [Plasmodiophora brassicae]
MADQVQAQHCIPARFDVGLPGRPATPSIVRVNAFRQSVEVFVNGLLSIEIPVQRILCVQVELRDPLMLTIYRTDALPIDIASQTMFDARQQEAMLRSLLDRSLKAPDRPLRSGPAQMASATVTLVLTADARLVITVSATPTTVVDLTSSKIRLVGKASIVLTGADDVDHDLEVGTERDRQEWIVAFNRAMALRAKSSQPLMQSPAPTPHSQISSAAALQSTENIAPVAHPLVQRPSSARAAAKHSVVQTTARLEPVAAPRKISFAAAAADDDEVEEVEEEPLPSQSSIAPVAVVGRSMRGMTISELVSGRKSIKPDDVVVSDKGTAFHNVFVKTDDSDHIKKDADEIADVPTPDGAHKELASDVAIEHDPMLSSAWSSSDRHVLSLQADGTLSLVNIADNLAYISASCSEAAAVTTSGHLLAWSVKDDGVTMSPVMRISTEDPSPVVFQSVSCGRDHHLALDGAGHLYGWGRCSLLGMRGQVKVVAQATRITAFESTTVTALATAAKHSVVCTEDNRLWTWGGQGPWLGRDQSVHHFKPVPLDITLTAKVSQIACATESTYVLTDQGLVYSCGSGRHGRLGHGDCLDRPALTRITNRAVQGRAVSIRAGSRHAALMDRDGALYVWGCNTGGQLGLVDPAFQRQSTVPVKVPAFDNVTISTVACGKSMTLAVTSSGALFRWGTPHDLDGVSTGDSRSTMGMVPMPTPVDLGRWRVHDVTCGYELVLLLAERIRLQTQEGSAIPAGPPVVDPIPADEDKVPVIEETTTTSTNSSTNEIADGMIRLEIRTEGQSGPPASTLLVPKPSLKKRLISIRDLMVKASSDLPEFVFLVKVSNVTVGFRQENTVRLSEVAVAVNGADNVFFILIRPVVNSTPRPSTITRHATSSNRPTPKHEHRPSLIAGYPGSVLSWSMPPPESEPPSPTVSTALESKTDGKSAQNESAPAAPPSLDEASPAQTSNVEIAPDGVAPAAYNTSKEDKSNYIDVRVEGGRQATSIPLAVDAGPKRLIAVRQMIQKALPDLQDFVFLSGANPVGFRQENTMRLGEIGTAVGENAFLITIRTTDVTSSTPTLEVNSKASKTATPEFRRSALGVNVAKLVEELNMPPDEPPPSITLLEAKKGKVSPSIPNKSRAWKAERNVPAQDEAKRIASRASIINEPDDGTLESSLLLFSQPKPVETRPQTAVPSSSATPSAPSSTLAAAKQQQLPMPPHAVDAIEASPRRHVSTQERIDVFMEGYDTPVGFVLFPRTQTLKLEDLRSVISESLGGKVPDQWLFLAGDAPIAKKQEGKFGVFGTIGQRAVLRDVAPVGQSTTTSSTVASDVIVKVSLVTKTNQARVMGAVLVGPSATLDDVRAQIINDLGMPNDGWRFTCNGTTIALKAERSTRLESYITKCPSGITVTTFVDPAAEEDQLPPQLQPARRADQDPSHSLKKAVSRRRMKVESVDVTDNALDVTGDPDDTSNAL